MVKCLIWCTSTEKNARCTHQKQPSHLQQPRRLLPWWQRHVPRSWGGTEHWFWTLKQDIALATTNQVSWPCDNMALGDIILILKHRFFFCLYKVNTNSTSLQTQGHAGMWNYRTRGIHTKINTQIFSHVHKHLKSHSNRNTNTRNPRQKHLQNSFSKENTLTIWHVIVIVCVQWAQLLW